MSILRLFVVLLLASAGLAAQGADGFVVAVAGRWINARTGKAIQELDSVSPGDLIGAARNASASDYAVISLPDGSRKQLNCPAGVCDRFTFPTVSGNSWWARVSSAIQALVPGVVRTGVIAASRGAAGPTEAVLEIRSADSLDLAPALVTLAPGEYSARFVPWPKPDEAGARSVSGSLVWRPPDASWAPKDHVSAGLYELTVADRDQEDVGAAIVLIAGPQDYSRFRLAFERLKEVTSSWNVPRSAEKSIRKVRVAFLVALSGDHSLAEANR
jgi:hypothetical protein